PARSSSGVSTSRSSISARPAVALRARSRAGRISCGRASGGVQSTKFFAGWCFTSDARRVRRPVRSISNTRNPCATRVRDKKYAAVLTPWPRCSCVNATVRAYLTDPMPSTIGLLAFYYHGLGMPDALMRTGVEGAFARNDLDHKAQFEPNPLTRPLFPILRSDASRRQKQLHRVISRSELAQEESDKRDKDGDGHKDCSEDDQDIGEEAVGMYSHYGA